MAFSPFDCDLSKLTTSQLVQLKDVAEGWYVEYKSALPSTRSIAKSISALANSYGGWLFFGIQESSAGDRKPGSVPGIPTADVAASEVLLRQAVAAHLSPAPYFELRSLRGPLSDMGLAEHHSVLVVQVPQSSQAPHVHSDGRIYRRVADESDPRPETDRHFLDLLFTRGKERRKRIRRKTSSILPKGMPVDGASLVEITFLPVPWGERLPSKAVGFEAFAKLMRGDTYESGGLPFDTFFSQHDGYVARQAKANNPARPVLTWKYDHDGTSHVVLPLSTYGGEGSVPQLRQWLRGYDQASNLTQLLTSEVLSSCSVIDLNMLHAVSWGVFRRLELLMEMGGLPFPMRMKIKLRGMGRRIPFLDVTRYGAFLEEYGVPIIHFDQASLPARGDFYEVGTDLADLSPEVNTGVRAAKTTGFICEALGLPLLEIFKSAEWFIDLDGALARAQKRQDNGYNKLP